MSSSVMKVVIVGGGSAGWMTAVALASLLSKKQVEVVVVESPDVASVGVGEATIPEIKLFNDLVGIDEIDFVINCQATYKLGIEFTNWGQKGHSYMHAFGSLGTPLDNLPFYQYWQRLYLEEQNLDLNDS